MTLDELLQELLSRGTVLVEIKLTLLEHPTPQPPEKIIAKCDKCGWSKPYPSEGAKKRGLRSHAGHCCGNAVIPDWLREQTNHLHED